MEISAARQIAMRYPGSSVTILSPFPEIDKPFYAPIAVAYCNRRRLLSASFDLLRGLAWRLVGFDWLLSPQMRLVREADLVVDLSGDMLTEDYGPHVAYSHYIPILRALIVGRPYFLCAQSIGPFKLTLRLARLLLERAAAITPRDGITQEYLMQLGIRNSRIEQTADLAFALEPATSSRTDEILAREAGTLDGRPIIGVSLSRLIERKFNTGNPAATATEFVDLIKSVLEGQARKRNARILFIAHVTGPNRAKDDRIIAARVRDMLSADVPSILLSGDYRPEELKAVIGRCAIFCGARMHANISALSSNIPTVAISYSHKTPGIMAACGVGEFVAPIESVTIETLAALIDRAFNEREEISRLLKTSSADLAAKTRRNIELIAELAAPSPDGATM